MLTNQSSLHFVSITDKGKKQILMILHLPPPVHGASTVGMQIKTSPLLSARFSCNFINLSTSVSLHEIGKTSVQKAWSFFLLIGKVFKALIFSKYDLVYITINSKGNGFYKDFIIVLIVKLFNRKSVFHFHNKGITLFQERIIDNILYRIAFNNAFCILLSPLLFADIKKYVKPENVFYCANGINLPMLYKEEKSKGELPVILFLSNMIRSKGVFLLLNALRILNSKGISFQCLFVGQWGDISENEFVTEVKDCGLEKNIVYMGPVFGRDKEKMLSKADLFVLPTVSDCFPLVILEAMSYKLPVVSSYEGGIPEIIVDGETGLLCNPCSTGSLSEKIEMLLISPELRLKMGIAGRKRVENHFTVEIFEQNLTKILTEIVAAGE